MQFGPMLDTAIGLVLVYVLLSLFVTTLLEVIASVLSLRGRKLLGAIDDLTQGFPAIPAAAAAGAALASNAIAKVSDHPYVAGPKDGRLPSYVEAGNFAKAALDHLGALDPAATAASIQAKVDTITDDRVRRVLTTMVQQTAGNVAALEGRISGWFNSAMDRVSGDYKRLSQYILLVIGIIVAVAFDASSISIGDRLWHDPVTRAQMVVVAQERVASGPPASGASAAPAAKAPAPAAAGTPAPKASTAPAADTAPPADLKTAIANTHESQQELADLPLALGWSDADKAVVANALKTTFPQFLLLLLGWVMTALAISMGSPFWFDLLQRLINIRTSGPKPGAAKRP